MRTVTYGSPRCVQIWNPRGWWVKIDRETGQILGHRAHRWPGVAVVEPQPHTEDK